mmetsp:Transcript_1837/g.4937  ORF Transcript_1837/g.4937 Transcript_1837/m.4937 type:complete len:82 (+) Transcript_1837:185-430(+)
MRGLCSPAAHTPRRYEVSFSFVHVACAMALHALSLVGLSSAESSAMETGKAHASRVDMTTLIQELKTNKTGVICEKKNKKG